MRLDRSGGNRQAGRLARRLAAYIPKNLALRVLHNEPLKPGEPHHFKAAALFCDVSGFSTMATELATDGPRGAEELNRVLLMTFTAMISAIHNAGGIVSHFHGDAMMVFMPDDDGQAAVRALACAQFMQSLMQGGYSEVVLVRPNQEAQKSSTFKLSMKVGVGYGDCLQVTVGDETESLESVVAGKTIDEAVEAESFAKAGEVVASRAVLEKAGLPIQEPFRVVSEMMPVPFAQTNLHWDAYDQDRLWQLAETAAAFVPNALHERIMTDNSYFVAEHRPATSIFVRFEGIDYAAEKAGRQLQAYYQWARHVVANYGGDNSRVNRILTGDKGSLLHIIFGAPVAPDAPDEAIRCALALQNEKPSFISAQQIGIATGQVFACAVGSQHRREYTIVGDVVNLSSRLADKCPTGSVLVDGITAERTRDRIKFEKLAPVELKGFNQPVHLYEALDEHKASDQIKVRFSQRRPLPWRDSEQARLISAINESLLGDPQVVSIYGPNNTENNRLLSVGVHQWLNAEGMALIGIGDQKTADVPFGIWQQIWSEFFHIMPDMDDFAQADAVVESMKRLLPDALDEEDLALWGELLSLPLPLMGWSSVARKAEMRHQKIIDMTLAYLQAAALENPILIILEKLQWADPLSLLLLKDLSRRLTNVPILILTTHIPSNEFTISLPSQATSIHLGELTTKEGRRLVQNLLNGMEPPAGLIRHLGLDDERAFVNPLFLEESIIMMLEGGILRINGNLNLDEQALAQMPLPESVHSLLLSRFDRISAASRTLLQAASVIGREFDLQSLINTLTDMNAAEAGDLLNELYQAQMINQISHTANPAYIFHDDMIHDVAYQSIPYGRRQQWHMMAARWIMRQHKDNLRPFYKELAYHFSRTDMHEQGLKFALEAAEEAYTNDSYQTAIKLFSIAEGHLGALEKTKLATPDTYFQVFGARAEMYALAGKQEEAIRDAERARDIALEHKDSARIGSTYTRLARFKLLDGKADEALEIIELVTVGFGHAMSVRDFAEAWLTKANTLTYLGELSAVPEAFQQAINLFQQAKYRPGLVRTHASFGYEYYAQLGDWEQAQHHLEQAQQFLGHNAENPYQDLIYLNLGLAFVAFQRGSLVTASDYIRRANSLMTQKRLVWWRPASFYIQSLMYTAQGNLEVARKILRKGVTAVNEGGNPDYLPLLYLNFAEVAEDPRQSKRLKERAYQALQGRGRYLDKERFRKMNAPALPQEPR